MGAVLCTEKLEFVHWSSIATLYYANQSCVTSSGLHCLFSVSTFLCPNWKARPANLAKLSKVFMYTEKTPEKLSAMELVPWLLWLTHTQQKCHSISKGLSCTKRREKERRYCGSMWSWTAAVCLTFFFFFFRLACANKFLSLVAFTMRITNFNQIGNHW